MTDSPSFLVRHEFLIRRLHSLSGLVPVGAYMVVHLLTNASVLNSYASFQLLVNRIHSLGNILPVVEWVFIFIPILFHAVIGFVIIGGGLPNNSQYRYGANWRYTLQRVTGMIAFVFIMWHVFHMHGWFHFHWWTKNVAEPFGGHQFRAYAASSTATAALQGHYLMIAFYAVGVAASVYHLANGLWTMGITWGAWITPQAQARAGWVCLAFGLGLGFVGLSALGGMVAVDRQEAVVEEDKIYNAGVRDGWITPDPKKRPKESEAGKTHIPAGNPAEQ